MPTEYWADYIHPLAKWVKLTDDEALETPDVSEYSDTDESSSSSSSDGEEGESERIARRKKEEKKKRLENGGIDGDGNAVVFTPRGHLGVVDELQHALEFCDLYHDAFEHISPKLSIGTTKEVMRLCLATYAALYDAAGDPDQVTNSAIERYFLANLDTAISSIIPIWGYVDYAILVIMAHHNSPFKWGMSDILAIAPHNEIHMTTNVLAFKHLVSTRSLIRDHIEMKCKSYPERPLFRNYKTSNMKKLEDLIDNTIKKVAKKTKGESDEEDNKKDKHEKSKNVYGWMVYDLGPWKKLDEILEPVIPYRVPAKQAPLVILNFYLLTGTFPTYAELDGMLVEPVADRRSLIGDMNTLVTKLLLDKKKGVSKDEVILKRARAWAEVEIDWPRTYAFTSVPSKYFEERIRRSAFRYMQLDVKDGIRQPYSSLGTASQAYGYRALSAVSAFFGSTQQHVQVGPKDPLTWSESFSTRIYDVKDYVVGLGKRENETWSQYAYRPVAAAKLWYAGQDLVALGTIVAAAGSAGLLYWVAKQSKKSLKIEEMSVATMNEHLTKFIEKNSALLTGASVIAGGALLYKVSSQIISVFRLKDWMDNQIYVSQWDKPIRVTKIEYVPQELIISRFSGVVYHDLGQVNTSPGPFTNYLRRMTDYELSKYFHDDMSRAYFGNDWKRKRRAWLELYFGNIQIDWTPQDDFCDTYKVVVGAKTYYVAAYDGKHARYLFLTHGYCSRRPSHGDLILAMWTRLTSLWYESAREMWPLFAIAAGFIASLMIFKSLLPGRPLDGVPKWGDRLKESAEKIVEGKTKGRRLGEAEEKRFIEDFCKSNGVDPSDRKNLIEKMQKARNNLRSEIERYIDEGYFDTLSYGNAAQRADAEQHLASLKNNLSKFEIVVDDLYNGELVRGRGGSGKGKNKPWRKRESDYVPTTHDHLLEDDEEVALLMKFFECSYSLEVFQESMKKFPVRESTWFTEKLEKRLDKMRRAMPLRSVESKFSWEDIFPVSRGEKNAWKRLFMDEHGLICDEFGRKIPLSRLTKRDYSVPSGTPKPFPKPPLEPLLSVADYKKLRGITHSGSGTYIKKKGKQQKKTDEAVENEGVSIDGQVTHIVGNIKIDTPLPTILVQEASTPIPQMNVENYHGAIVPIFVDDGKPNTTKKVLMFATKIKFGTETYLYTKKHGQNAKACFIDANDKIVAIKWNDWHVCGVDTIRVKFNVYNLPHVSTLIGVDDLEVSDFTFYTFDANLKPAIASGSIFFNADSYEYQHSLTTRDGQCGCPYVTKLGKVFALHGGANLSLKNNFGHPIHGGRVNQSSVSDFFSSTYVKDEPVIYDAFQYVATTRQPPAILYPVAHLVRYPNLIHELSPQLLDLIKKETPLTYYAVSINMTAVMKSISKMDTKKISNENPMFVAHLDAFLDKKLALPLSAPSMTINEAADMIDMDKGPGYPWAYFGFDTRAEVLQKYPDYLQNPYYKPIYKATPKADEWMTEKEIVEDFKCRTFIIPPVELLLHQTAMCYNANDAMKNYWWSAYGFNPFSGGVNRLAKHLLTKRLRFMWDFSGWDRDLILTRTYERRMKFSDYPKKQWVADNTCAYLLRLPNADIVSLAWTNPSGQGSTTVDNILEHMRKICYVLIAAYYEKYSKLPQWDLLEEQVIYLYGDDLIASVDEDFDQILDFQWLKKIVADQGMTLKFFYGGLDYPLTSLTFLGFTFVDFDEFWLPKWDTDRILTALMFNRTQEVNHEKLLSRVYSLTILSFADAKVHSICSYAYSQLLRFAQSKMQGSTVARAFVIGGVPTMAELLGFYLGFEARDKTSVTMPMDEEIGLLFFTYLEEEDQKKMAYFTVWKPTTVLQSNGGYVSTGLFQGDVIVRVSGTDVSPELAYAAWENNVEQYIANQFETWSDEMMDSVAHGMTRNGKFFAEGGKNAYGNEQILSKNDYFTKYPARGKGMNDASRDAVYKSYVSYMARKNRKKGVKQIVGPTRKRAFGPPRRRQNRQNMAATEIGARPVPKMRTPRSNQLSDCARKYAAAVVNPFSLVDGSLIDQNKTVNGGVALDASDACIPTFPPLKSRRTKVFVSGTLTCQPDGRGAIVLAPRRLANNYGVTNDTQAPVITLLTGGGMVAGQAFPGLDAGTSATGITGANWNSDYTVTAVTTATTSRGIEYRVVCAGLRIRYTGAELTRSGTIYAIEEPGHNSLNGMSYNDLNNYESSFKCPVTRKWCTLTYTPVLEEDLHYYSDPIANAYTLAGQTHFMGMAIQGAPGSAPFEWEAVCLMEVIGSAVRDLKPAHTDINGLSTVLNTVTPNTQKMLSDGGPVTVFKEIIKGAEDLTGMSVGSLVTAGAKMLM